MGRMLKRVPMDFDWPMHKVWEGYAPPMSRFKELFGEEQPWILEAGTVSSICTRCEEANGCCSENAPYCVWHNARNKAENETVFASVKAPKEEWLRMMGSKNYACIIGVSDGTGIFAV